MALVTVYVPCNNYASYLETAIESVIAQVWEDWELFIIDEGSKDDTWKIIEFYERRWPEKIFGIRNLTALGLQKTANEVLSRASGKYFIRLDADDWFEKHALLLMVAHFQKDNDVGIVFGNYFITDESGKILGREESPSFEEYATGVSRPPHGACTMVRTRSLRAVGGYSEDINAQDGWELWYKLIGTSKVVRIEHPIFYYRQHGQSLSRNSARLLKARAQIYERLAPDKQNAYTPSVMVVLGVRESYPGLEGVPYLQFQDKSLLEHSLISISEATCPTEVMVSSTCSTVLAFAERLEMDRRVPPHLRCHRQLITSEKFVPVDQILTCAAEHYLAEKSKYPDIAIFCSLHSVNRRGSHIDQAVNILLATRCDSVVSSSEERDLLFRENESGLEILNPGRILGIQRDRERLHKFNGAIIAVWFDVLVEGDLLGSKISPLEMTREESFTITDVI